MNYFIRMLQTRLKLIIIQSKITLNFESVERVQVILSYYIILHYIMLYVIMLQLHYSEEEMIS